MMGGPQWFWFLRNESVMYRAIGERQMREEEEEGEEFLVVLVGGECCGSQWWRLNG